MRLLSRSIAASLVLIPTVLSAQIIDQNASTNNSYMAGFNQADLAQSFKQSANNISGAGIYLMSGIGSGASVLTINLWNLLPNQVGATMLATGNVAFSANDAWADVFWSPVGIVSGQTYFLEFLSSNSSYGIAGDTDNGYADGQTYANEGFGSFPGFDYTFRTYSGDVSEVPEPATVALMLSGLVCLYGASRRRRA